MAAKFIPAKWPASSWADDEWLSSIVTYARNAFGNHGPAITPKELAAVRGETATRNKPYTLEELKTVQAPAADRK